MGTVNEAKFQHVAITSVTDGRLVLLANRPEAAAPWLTLLARAGVSTQRAKNGSYTFTLGPELAEPAEIAGWPRVEAALAHLRAEISKMDPQEQERFAEYVFVSLQLALRALPAAGNAFPCEDGGG